MDSRMEDVVSTLVAEGGCFCGAVRYRVRDRPLNGMICHCESCRRVAAAPAVGWLTYPSANFELLQGQLVEFRSSPSVRRTFCAACGTPLTYRHDESSEVVDVTTCSLDAPGSYPPTHHSRLSHDIAWVRFGDGLPAFPQSRPQSGT